MRFRPEYISLVAVTIAATLTIQSAHAITIDFEDVVPTLGDGLQITVTVPDQIGNPFAPQISQGFEFRWFEGESGSPTNPLETHGHLSRGGKEDGTAWVWVASNDPTDRLLSSTYLITDDSAFNNINNTLSISPEGFVPAPPISPAHTSNDDDDDDDDDTGGGNPPAPPTGFSIQSFEVAEIFSSTQSARQILVQGFFDDGDDIADLTLPIVNLDEDFDAVPPVPPELFITEFQTVLFGPEWTGLKLVVFDGEGSFDPDADYFAVDNIIVNEPVIVDPPVDPDDPDDGVDVPEPSSLAIFGFATIVLGWMARRRDNTLAAALVRLVKK